MNIKINSVKFKADPKLESFVNNKVSKLERTFDNITSCEVSLKVDKPESDNNKIVEIQLVLPGQTLFNSKQADSFEEAVLQAVDATKNQLSKYKEKFNKKTMRYPYALTHSLNASGNVKLTSRWNVNYSSGYDFTQKKMSMTTVNISRDLHCFTMTASFVPVGPYKSYNFHIGVKSSMLKDLKYDKRSSTSNGITWY